MRHKAVGMKKKEREIKVNLISLIKLDVKCNETGLRKKAGERKII